MQPALGPVPTNSAPSPTVRAMRQRPKLLWLTGLVVFALAAGFRQTIDIGTFAFAVFAGRSLRFFFLGGLLFLFGEKIKRLLDKHLGWVTAVLLVLIILWLLGFVSSYTLGGLIHIFLVIAIV